jgi:glycosyltransferase involved in cell wall biosynthesis
VLEKAYRYPADVVHVHDLPMLLPGTVLARTWRVPLVYDAHELYYSQKCLPPEIRRKYFRLEKRLIREADIAITVNEFLAQVMAERYGVAAPHVLYNAAELPAPAAPGESRLRERVGGTGPIILLQGWIDARNTDAIVRAMPYVAEPAVLAIIGYGPNEPLLRQLARDLGIEHRVHFLGAIPSDEILHYTRGASLGVIPYLPQDDNGLYCSPNKFFEFVLTGVPILAHELPFFVEMRRRHGVAEFADFTSPQAVGEKITQLMREGRLKDMAARCRDAAKVLNWPVEGAKLLALYSTLQTRRMAA